MSVSVFIKWPFFKEVTVVLFRVVYFQFAFHIKLPFALCQVLNKYSYETQDLLEMAVRE